MGRRERMEAVGNSLIFIGLVIIGLAAFRPKIIWDIKGLQKLVGWMGYYEARTLFVLSSFIAIGFGVFLAWR